MVVKKRTENIMSASGEETDKSSHSNHPPKPNSQWMSDIVQTMLSKQQKKHACVASMHPNPPNRHTLLSSTPVLLSKDIHTNKAVTKPNRG